MVYATASPRENSAVCSVCLHHHNIFNTKQNMVLSNNSCSFKFYFKKIKLNNISIYKRQFFPWIVFFFCFLFYKISLKIYCHLILMRAPLPLPPTLWEKYQERDRRVGGPLPKKLNDQISTAQTSNQPLRRLVRRTSFASGFFGDCSGVQRYDDPSPPSNLRGEKYTEKGALVLVTYYTLYCTI